MAVLVDLRARATDGSTATTRVKTALPTANGGDRARDRAAGPTAGVVQDQPPGDDSETKVVPAGRVSASVTRRGAARARVGHRDGVGQVGARRSPGRECPPWSPTGRPTVADAWSWRWRSRCRGSGRCVAEEAVAVLDMTVPAAVAGSTVTISVKTALPTAERRRSSRRPCRSRRPPACVHDQPAGEESETNVVPAGSVSVTRRRRGVARAGVGHRDRVGRGCCRRHRIGRVDLGRPTGRPRRATRRRCRSPSCCPESDR